MDTDCVVTRGGVETGHLVEGGQQVRPLGARGVDAAADPHDRPLLRHRPGGHRLEGQAQRGVGDRLRVERPGAGRDGDHGEHGDHEAQAEGVAQEPSWGQAPHGRQDVVSHPPRRSIGHCGTAAPTRLRRHTWSVAHIPPRGAEPARSRSPFGPARRGEPRLTAMPVTPAVPPDAPRAQPSTSPSAASSSTWTARSSTRSPPSSARGSGGAGSSASTRCGSRVSTA